MGAGAIGCYLGGCLHAAGVPVAFVGRPRVLDALRAHGLELTDLDGASRRVEAAALSLHERVPPGLAPALVLLTVKSGATAQAAAQLAAALPRGTAVVSMQNGLSNAATAQAAAPSLRLLAGMVPYNIAELGPGRYHRGTTGELAAQDDPALRERRVDFERAGLPLRLHPDLRALQWGKLLLNLNNPVNALSGRALRTQLMERGYRQCLAALQTEALALLQGAGVEPAQVAALPPRRVPPLLRLPTPLFRVIAARMLRIDPRARSSMADDLAHGRPTEVDALCGEVVRLAAAQGREAPINARMVALVQAWPQRPEPMSPAAMKAALR
ncbi:MAG TPA: 2-dehydropantoate 2-reductase, partial [Burkholderiaceae bacterium]